MLLWDDGMFIPEEDKLDCAKESNSPMLMLFCREMQLFLLGYVVIEICEIFTVGGFPLAENVRKVS